MTLTDGMVRAVLDDPDGREDDARVLNAALSAFLEFGIRRTSVGEIAARSGLSPATLYRRFAGKDDIVWAVGRREARRLIHDVDAKVDHLAPAEDQIVSMFLAFLNGLRTNTLLQRLMATDAETILPLLTVHAGPVLALGRQYVADFVRRVSEQLGLSAEVAEPVAELVARVALSLALTPESCIPLDDEEMATLFARQFLTGLLGSGR